MAATKDACKSGSRTDRPVAALLSAWAISARSASFVRNPRAPARSASRTEASLGVGREYDDGDLGMLRCELSRCVKSIKNRHVQVQQDGVGSVLVYEFECLLTVRGAGDDLEIGQKSEEQDESFSNAGLIVGDDDSQGRVELTHSGTRAGQSNALDKHPHSASRR